MPVCLSTHHRNIFYQFIFLLIVLAGKLAAEVVSERAAGIQSNRPSKAIPNDILEKPLTPKKLLGRML